MKYSQGQVKWFHAEKGYGFILQEEVGDVFVHHSHILEEGYRRLEEKEVVSYMLKKGAKGWYAQDVRRDKK